MLFLLPNLKNWKYFSTIGIELDEWLVLVSIMIEQGVCLVDLFVLRALVDWDDLFHTWAHSNGNIFCEKLSCIPNECKCRVFWDLDPFAIFSILIDLLGVLYLYICFVFNHVLLIGWLIKDYQNSWILLGCSLGNDDSRYQLVVVLRAW
jgi:hypothetical protein